MRKGQQSTACSWVGRRRAFWPLQRVHAVTRFSPGPLAALGKGHHVVHRQVLAHAAVPAQRQLPLTGFGLNGVGFQVSSSKS